MQYKRILLKLSGEALMGDRQYGIDPKRLQEYAKEIKEVLQMVLKLLLLLVEEISLEVLQVQPMEWIVYKEITWEC